MKDDLKRASDDDLRRWLMNGACRLIEYEFGDEWREVAILKLAEIGRELARRTQPPTFGAWVTGAVYHWGQDAHRRADQMGIAELLGLSGALGDTGPDIAALVEFPAGFMTLDHIGRYWTVCDQQDLTSRDFSEVARFLWENHARHELAAV